MTALTIDYVIDGTPCADHDAARGEACWSIAADTRRDPLLAICDRRARKAGCDGRPPQNVRHPHRAAPTKERMKPTGPTPNTWQDRLVREIHERQSR